MIDPRAIVDPSVEIGANVAIGPWTVVGADVTIGDDCWIASHVVLKGPTTLGRGTKIYQFSTVGEDTPAFDYQGERTTLEIGADNIIREGVTIHRGTVQDQGRTVIGDNNLLMAYVHIGHDCEIGNHVIMANNAALSGHVVIGDYVNMGGYAGVPQYRSVGAYTHIAAMSLVLKDVPAFLTVAGNPASAVGLNLEGMKRRNVAKSTIAALRNAYRVVYRQGLTVDEALLALRDEVEAHPEVALFVSTIETSKQGIVRERREADPLQ